MEDGDREYQTREMQIIDKYEQNLPENWENMNVSEAMKKLTKISQPNYGKQKEYMAQAKKQIDLLFEQIKLKEEKISSLRNDTSNSDQISNLISKLQDIKKNLSGVSEERKQLLKQKDELEKASQDSKSKEKSMKSGLKYHSVEEIDDEIADLEYKHDTESLTVAEQKEILKELSKLKQSRKSVEEFSKVSGKREYDTKSFTDVNGRIKSLGEQIGKYVEEITKYQGEIDKRREVKSVDKTTGLRDEKQKMYDELKKMKDERKTKNDEFNQQIKDFEVYQEQVQNLNYIKRKQDYLKRKEAEELKVKEKEEIKKTIHPYIKEINTAIRLISYLETLKPKSTQNVNKPKSVPSEITLSDGAVQMKLKKDVDTFGGYVSKKGKKGGNKQANQPPNPPTLENKDTALPPDTNTNTNKPSNKNKNKKNKSHALPLGLSTIADFQLLDVKPPIDIDDVLDCIKLLIEKKTYYENLEPVSESTEDTTKNE